LIIVEPILRKITDAISPRPRHRRGRKRKNNSKMKIFKNVNDKSFSKIWIIIIIIFIIGGVSSWQYWRISKEGAKLPKEIAPEKIPGQEPLIEVEKELMPEEMIPEPEEILLLENQIENWDLYNEIKNNENKWVGADLCGNEEFKDVLIQAKSGSMRILKLNDELDLVITPNYKGWSIKKFVAFNNDPTAICAAGGRYPAHAYSDKLLWVGVCTTGFSPETTSPAYKEWKERQIRCEKAREIVTNFFEKKLNWNTYTNPEANFTFKYPGDWRIVSEYFYETLAGFKSKWLTVTLGKEGKEEISINLRQASCASPNCKCKEIGGNIVQTCSYDNLEVREIYNQILSTFEILK